MKEAIFPFVVLCCLIFVISLSLRKRDKLRADYDERQMIFRGYSYRYGFLTMSTLNILFALISAYDKKYAGYGIGFLTISFVAGLLVYAVYNIWNDSFMTMRQNRTAYMILLAAVSLIQFINFFSNPNGRNLDVLMSSVSIVPLGCAVLFAAILVAIVLKQITQGREEQ